jgi:transposase-like protein
MARSVDATREAFWRKLIARQASAGVSVSELCRQADVSVSSFYYWRQRLQPSRAEAPGPTLVPVRIVADAVPRELRDGKDGTIGRRLHDSQQITIEIASVPSSPSHIRVSLPLDSDEASIRRVLRAVMSVREGGPACS